MDDSLMDMRTKMRRLFRNQFCCTEHASSKLGSGKTFRTPIADMKEVGDNLVIEIEMPGVDNKDIELTLTENSLEISAQKKSSKKIEQEGAYLSERNFSSFQRRMSLPVEVIPEKASARFDRGVLHIEVPKAGFRSRRKKIKIE